MDRFGAWRQRTRLQRKLTLVGAKSQWIGTVFNQQLCDHRFVNWLMIGKLQLVTCRLTIELETMDAEDPLRRWAIRPRQRRRPRQRW